MMYFQAVLPGLVAALVLGGSTALAAEPAAPKTVAARATVDVLAASVASDADLADKRGGSDTHVSSSAATSTVTGNIASQLTTGANTISESAFSDSAGIPVVIQNSGNNVSIQNSTILNLQLSSK